MGYIVETFLICDGNFEGCDDSFGVDSRELNGTKKELIIRAIKDGWYVKGKKHFCQYCKSKLILSEINF